MLSALGEHIAQSLMSLFLRSSHFHLVRFLISSEVQHFLVFFYRVNCVPLYDICVLGNVLFQHWLRIFQNHVLFFLVRGDQRMLFTALGFMTQNFPVAEKSYISIKSVTSSSTAFNVIGSKNEVVTFPIILVAVYLLFCENFHFSKLKFNCSRSPLSYEMTDVTSFCTASTYPE